VPQYGWGALYDKAKAKQMLFNAGYGKKNADGSIAVQGKDGKPVKLTLVTTPGSNISENLAYLVSRNLAV